MPGVVPANPAIYHITHLRNLANILSDGCLWSDSKCIQLEIHNTNIGHQHIKDRRLKRRVPIAAYGTLGDYVPFYFCNRSVMLYVVGQGHQDYNGGQDEVVHLVSNAQNAIALGRPWAFTDRHAELGYAEYFDNLINLDEIDWDVMPLGYWAGSEDTKEKRQAEFLVHERFSWSAIDKIGVHNASVAVRVRELVGADGPPVLVKPSWYY